jgi:hypothetical protein
MFIPCSNLKRANYPPSSTRSCAAFGNMSFSHRTSSPNLSRSDPLASALAWLLEEIKAAWPEWERRAFSDDWKTPLPFLVVEKTLFTESGTWLERLVILLMMAAVGSVLLYDLYAGSWLSPGVLRGFVAWCVFTVFYAKLFGVFSNGGPIVSAVFGLFWIAALESVVYWKTPVN